ncbi:MAG: hypothetical protein JKX84_10710 [Flavobacteriales bacterium]|nr:hypothetical protein [Flavobacteriales bacterium]
MKHPIVVLKPIRSQRDLIFSRGALINLDLITSPVLKTLRNEWHNDPLSLGGDIIYLFNKELPIPIPEEEKDVPSK